MCKRFAAWLLCLLAVFSTSAGAQQPYPAGTRLAPGTVSVPPELASALIRALAEAQGIAPGGEVYAVTALQATGEWAIISVAGLEDLAAGDDWTLEDATWLGFVLLHRAETGPWTGAVQGTAAFSEMLSQVPDAVLSPLARRQLDPLRRPLAPASDYRFPWQPGSKMVYGGLGVHQAGFIDGWKAVDFLSDGDTAAGHAPNSLLAAAAGAIDYVCNDGTSVAIRVGDLLYVHLALSEELVVGRAFDLGEEIGRLKPGPFRDRCGWASQAAGWFHLHWGFPGGNSFQGGGWTLDLGDGLWRRGDETRGTGYWFAAGEIPSPTPSPMPSPSPTPSPSPSPSPGPSPSPDPTSTLDTTSTPAATSTPEPCPLPVLIQPADGATLSGPEVVFSWSPVSGCTFDGYVFRVCTTVTLEDVEDCLVDAVEQTTMRTETLDGQGDRELYWGVQAVSTLGGAEWAQRSFRVQLAPTRLMYLPLFWEARHE